MSEKLSERLIERAEFEDERVLKEAKAMGFVPEVYSGSQTGALLREAAAALRAVEGAARGHVIVPYGDSVEFALADDRAMKFVNARPLRNQLCALVPLDAAGSAEGGSDADG